MGLEQLQMGLSAAGWKDVQPGQVQGLDFDLIGTRHWTLTKWNILVKVLPRLDAGVASTWQQNLQMLSKASKSYIWGKCFVLCLVAEEVAPEVIGTLKGDSFGLGGVLRLQGGGGNVLVADAGTGQVYGRVPALPVDVHTFTASARDVLQREARSVVGSAPRASVAPVTPAQILCPKCGRAAKPEAKFCDACGVVLHPTCAACGAALRPGARFCETCGKAVEAGPEATVPQA